MQALELELSLAFDDRRLLGGDGPVDTVATPNLMMPQSDIVQLEQTTRVRDDHEPGNGGTVVKSGSSDETNGICFDRVSGECWLREVGWVSHRRGNAAGPKRSTRGSGVVWK